MQQCGRINIDYKGGRNQCESSSCFCMSKICANQWDDDILITDPGSSKFTIYYGPDYQRSINYFWSLGSDYQVFTGDFNGDGIDDMGLRDTSSGLIKYRLGLAFNQNTEITVSSLTDYIGDRYQICAGDSR